MKKMKPTIYIVLIIMVVFISFAKGGFYTVFNDGETHNIDYYLGFVLVDTFTTLNLLTNGGATFSISGFGNSSINFLGGGVTDGVDVTDNCQVTMHSGHIGAEDGLRASGNSQIAIYGGTVGTLSAYDNSKVTIYGGNIGPYIPIIQIDNEAILTIVGSDFAIDQNPISFGEITSIEGGWCQDEPIRQLTCTLANGDVFDQSFKIGGTSKIVLIPEPATISLFCLGLIALRRKK